MWGIGVFGAQEHAVDVDRHQRVPVLLLGGHHIAADTVARIVDQDVETTVSRHLGVHHSLHSRALADVDGEGRRLVAETLGHLRSLGAIEIRHHDACALAHEKFSRRLADPGRCAGDEGDLVVQTHDVSRSGLLQVGRLVREHGVPRDLAGNWADAGQPCPCSHSHRPPKLDTVFRLEQEAIENKAQKIGYRREILPKK